MVGPISTQTEVIGIITDEMHPYTHISKKLHYLKIRCRRGIDASWPYHPYSLFHLYTLHVYAFMMCIILYGWNVSVSNNL